MVFRKSPFSRMRFSLIPPQEAYLSAYKGSLLRGAFGYALRRTVCVMGPQQPCPTCKLRKQLQRNIKFKRVARLIGHVNRRVTDAGRIAKD